MVKVKKGFKVDRHAAKRDLSNLRKGKRGKENTKLKAEVSNNASASTAARPKIIKFNTDAMKDYVTGFHVRKNQRRMYAMKKAKEDHRATVNSERRERREERRKIYNNISQFQINEAFRLEMPGDDQEEAHHGDEDMASDAGSSDSYEVSDDVSEDVAEPSTHKETYSGANEDTEVDVEVEELDLGGFGGASSSAFAGQLGGTLHKRAKAKPKAPTEDPSAFPAVPAPTRVRLIRKRR